MNRFITISAVLSSILIPVALGQQPLYALCGGKAWTGPTECAAGGVCTVLNEYWFQCLPAPRTTSDPEATRTIEARDPTTSPLAPLYSFCGDGAAGWATAKECVPGAVCHYVNQYWSQCIPIVTTTP